MRLRIHTIKFVLGLVKEATILTHNINSPTGDKSSAKSVTTFKEVVEYGKDIRQPNRFINGKRIEYVKVISAFDFSDNFLFIVLYKNA